MLVDVPERYEIARSCIELGTKEESGTFQLSFPFLRRWLRCGPGTDRRGC